MGRNIIRVLFGLNFVDRHCSSLIPASSQSDYTAEEKMKNNRKADRNIYSRKRVSVRIKSFTDILKQAANKNYNGNDSSTRSESKRGVSSYYLNFR